MTLFERFISLFFKHIDIVKTVDGEQVVYLRRWFIGSWKGKLIYLHKIFMSDDDPDPHCHPWDFTTYVLKNGYYDESYKWTETLTSEGWKKTLVGPFLDELGFLSKRVREAEWIHQVKKKNDKPAWTLLFRGKYRREWGFWKHDGFVFWRKYLNEWGENKYDIDQVQKGK